MSGMSDAPKTVFLHVGCRKSGTTALQLGLRRSAADLAAAGLAQPLPGRARTLNGLVEPLRRAGDGDQTAAREAVARLARRIRDSEHPRHLITLEALAELPAAATTLVVQGLSEFDTHLVVTSRPWALTIPSEWQQRVKSRFTAEFSAYARAVQEPGSGALDAEGELFRRRQDVADVVRRWRAGNPELPAHVILVPSDPRTSPGLHELFCAVVGIDADALRAPGRVRNPSLTREDAEVLRRLNLALGDRLQNLRGNYRYSVRKWIAVRTMMRQSRGSRIRLPQELEGWAFAESARQLAELEDMGCEVLGDPASFVEPRLSGDSYRPVTDAEVAEASVALLADLAADHSRQRRRARLARRKAGRRGKASSAARPPAATRRVRMFRRRLRSAARRVAARLGR
jgi:hypothetical protein